MADLSPLQRLATRCGIALAYSDIFGAERVASERVLRRLLTAMGALPEPEADPVAALAAWEDAHWQAPLPPVLVAREGEPLRVPLALADELAWRPLRWRVVTEHGDSHEDACSLDRQDILGGRVVAARAHLAFELVLGLALPPGYHRLELLLGSRRLAATPLIVAPPTCYLPPALADGGRIWGPAVQLYSLRSRRNWGIGDFTDLRQLAQQWAEQGADIVGISPLHALFLGNPGHASPYSPSSRGFLNVVYLDVEAVPDFRECESARTRVRSAAFQSRLQALRESPLVDYPGVAAAKLTVLGELYSHFRAHHLSGPSARGRAFRAFQHRGGKALRDYALFEALYEHRRVRDPQSWSWQQWPPEYREPDCPAVVEFARAHGERIEFFEYLQWQAEQQLEDTDARLAGLGMGVGLYLDLAVSVDRGGVDCWRDQSLYAQGANVGAPPDDFNRQGQDWGLPPYNPHRLRQAAYAPFIAVLRENMRRAGALRIDHVMGLMRLYWIPHGMSAAEGAYVHYALEEMLGIVALESHRNRCLIIGEDLGTVPDEVRQAMQRTRMLSYRLLYFEKDGTGDFKPVRGFPQAALAAVSTHDLPTLAGFWEGRDIRLRTELGLFDSEAARANQTRARTCDRAALLAALEREGLLPQGVNVESVPELSEELARNVHIYLARSNAAVLMVQPEDVLRTPDQANLPGSLEDQHPNWRRKLALALEEWPQHAPFLSLASALNAERPRGRPLAARGNFP